MYPAASGPKGAGAQAGCAIAVGGVPRIGLRASSVTEGVTLLLSGRTRGPKAEARGLGVGAAGAFLMIVEIRRPTRVRGHSGPKVGRSGYKCLVESQDSDLDKVIRAVLRSDEKRRIVAVTWNYVC